MIFTKITFFIVWILACFNSNVRACEMTETIEGHEACVKETSASSFSSSQVVDVPSNSIYLTTNGGGASEGGASGGGAPSSTKIVKPSSQVRRQVTLDTIRKTNNKLREIKYSKFHLAVSLQHLSAPGDLKHRELSRDLQNRIRTATMYAQPGGESRSRRDVLRRFDIVSIYTRMDYQADWTPYPSSPQNILFPVMYVAAPNIGDSRASDFHDYSSGNPPRLNRGRYIGDMGKIFANILYATQDQRRDEIVMTGFGLGAFIRHLGDKDSTYKDKEKLFHLVRDAAKAFMDEIKKYPNIQVHICIPQPTTTHDIGNEAFRNLTAFRKASSNIRNVHIHVDTDAASFAQSLANQSRNPILIIAGNRHFFGNHWPDFETAPKAQEENLHRKAYELCATAYLLNGVLNTGDSMETWITHLQGTTKRLPQYRP